MPAKTLPDFNLLALKIPPVLFLTRTSPSFFSFLELGLQSCRLEKQPSPGVCITPTAFPGGDFSRRGLGPLHRPRPPLGAWRRTSSLPTPSMQSCGPAETSVLSLRGFCAGLPDICPQEALRTRAIAGTPRFYSGLIHTECCQE